MVWLQEGRGLYKLLHESGLRISESLGNISVVDCKMFPRKDAS